MPNISKSEQRQRFHRQQMACPDVLIDALDPDAPVLLPAHLTQYDPIIRHQLRNRGWPNTSGNGSPPKMTKGTSLARKIAKGRGMSEEDIALLANRINWMQNNSFRWNMRDGYDAYFSAKAASGGHQEAVEQNRSTKIENSIGPSDGGARDINVSNGTLGASAESLQQSSLGPSTPSNQMRGAIHQTQRAQSRQAEKHRGPIFISADDPLPGDSATDVISRGFPAEPELQPAPHIAGSSSHFDGPNLPDRPKTFGKTFPIAKASAFLVSNATGSAIEEQLRLGEALINDPDELRASLAHSEQARIDILNAFGKLGLKTDV